MKFSAKECFELDQKENIFAHWTLKNFEEELGHPHSQVFYLCDGQTLQGFLFYRILDEDLSIMNVAVYPRRQGLGRRFMGLFFEHLHETSPELLRVLLEVRESNVAAIRLYKRLGFSELSRRLRYYGEEAALVLEKMLKNEEGTRRY